MSINYTYEKFTVGERLGNEIRASAIVTALDYITVSGGVTTNVWFKTDLSVGDKTILDALVASHVPTAVAATGLSAAGNPIVETTVLTGPAGSKSVSLVTPDLTDRTTWYQKSVQVTNETLVDSGDGLTFTSANSSWINIYSPKLTYTHKQIPKRDGTYGKHADWATIVKVNSVVQTTGYTVNFTTGHVTFDSSKAGSTVTATYWHINGVANPIEWLLVPPAGKKYIVEHCELQFSKNITYDDTIRFEIWAGSTLATYGSFPDYLFEAGYGQMRADYRGARDFMNAANLGQSLPAFGELSQDIIILPFNYVQAFTLDSSVGALFRLHLVNDGIFTGELATATFYVQLI